MLNRGGWSPCDYWQEQGLLGSGTRLVIWGALLCLPSLKGDHRPTESNDGSTASGLDVLPSLSGHRFTEVDSDLSGETICASPGDPCSLSAHTEKMGSPFFHSS